MNGKDKIQELIDETPIKSCTISCGERLSYRAYHHDIDKSTKYTLVVIAGYGGDSTHLAAELSVLPQLSDHKLIGINPRGWGKSSSSQNNINYTHEENAQDIKEVIDIIGLKTTMVIGHSTGGPIASLLGKKKIYMHVDLSYYRSNHNIFLQHMICTQYHLCINHRSNQSPWNNQGCFLDE